MISDSEEITGKTVNILAYQAVITAQGENYTGEKDWALNKLRDLFKEELQKALEIQAIEIREEEANEYNKIIEQELQKERERCITKAWSYIVDATHAESWSRDELRKAVQSELDQPDALTK